MDYDKKRRKFIQKFGYTAIFLGASEWIPLVKAHGIGVEYIPGVAEDYGSLSSISPEELFSFLNMEHAELAVVRKKLEAEGLDAGLQALLEYYREKYKNTSSFDKVESGNQEKRSIERADNITQHRFQWGPYELADYGEDIDWAADPANDIEWVASMYRFNWTGDLADAYKITHDEKYAQAFVDLVSDWIKKHPLEKTIDEVHPVYGPGKYGKSGWKGYAWLDIQTGRRAMNLCSSFLVFLHSEAFTPQFLGMLMASLYDHQVKTLDRPMNMVHNKSIFEQRGFFNILQTFPEFKEKDKWMKAGMDTTIRYLIAQTTSDGVQREWCGGYHMGVYRDALDIEQRVNDLGGEMPGFYHQRLKKMVDHVFGISTPELSFPMFGDTSRPKRSSNERSSWQLYHFLKESSDIYKDPKYRALADLDEEQLPKNGSKAFSEAGLYAMRNSWKPDQVYMALHCSPPGMSIHDFPDNGTFELYAYGKWLMPSSGFYTYGNDLEARNWHRQTKVHATLTCDGENTARAGRQLHWDTNEDMDVLCVENQSYERFIHRRTVWFVDKKGQFPFFVMYDEAIGDKNGKIEVHYHMAPGEVVTDQKNRQILTRYQDVNLLIKINGWKPVNLQKHDGWHAWAYGKRERRTSVSARYEGSAPFVYASVLVPFKGRVAPDARFITPSQELISGKDPIDLKVEVAGKEWTLRRDLS